MTFRYPVRRALALLLVAGVNVASAQESPQPFRGFGPLVPAVLGEAVDAPEQLTVQTLSRVGDFMTDALHVPMLGSGLGVFPLADGRMVLLSAHDIPPGTPSRSGPFGMQSYLLMTGRDTTNVYDLGPERDKPSYGSVTASIIDPTGRIALQNRLAVSGLMRAFRGTSTNSGTWLVGEAETRTPDDRYAKPHGYVFEIDPRVPNRRPRPLQALGRFAHAGIAQDPTTGTVYMSEAREDGLLYRFQPARDGDWTAGTMSVLSVTGSSVDAANRRIEWLELGAIDTGADDLRVRGAELGATAFSNAGGLLWVDGTLYLCATQGATGSSLWAIQTEGHVGTLAPVGLPSDAPSKINDVAVAPWGDLLVVGTGSDGHAKLVGVADEGSVYPVLRSARPDGRISAPAFSHDGRTMFVSLPVDGLLLSIRGPWPQRGAR